MCQHSLAHSNLYSAEILGESPHKAAFQHSSGLEPHTPTRASAPNIRRFDNQGYSATLYPDSEQRQFFNERGATLWVVLAIKLSSWLHLNFKFTKLLGLSFWASAPDILHFRSKRWSEALYSNSSFGSHYPPPPKSRSLPRFTPAPKHGGGFGEDGDTLCAVLEAKLENWLYLNLLTKLRGLSFWASPPDISPW